MGLAILCNGHLDLGNRGLDRCTNRNWTLRIWHLSIGNLRLRCRNLAGKLLGSGVVERLLHLWHALLGRVVLLHDGLLNGGRI